MSAGARSSSPVPGPPRSAPGGRYSLRTLFFVSVVIAIPFLLLANTRNFARPDESLGSPLYLIAGVLIVLISAAIGSALGGTKGLLVLAGGAAASWILLVLVCSEFSHTLWRLLPVHALAAIATVAGLAYVVRSRREESGEGPHPVLARLLAVKEGLHRRPASDSTQTAPVSAESIEPVEVVTRAVPVEHDNPGG